MKKKTILLLLRIIVIGLFIGGMLIKGTEKLLEPEPTIKESPYTLDELYSIVENPKEFYKLNTATMTDYNIVMFHFYDYFSNTTPVKVATKVKRDNNNKVTKVLEIKYLTKEEYIEWMEAAYTYELSEIKAYEERNKKYNQNAEPVFNYSMYIDELIYGHAKEEK